MTTLTTEQTIELLTKRIAYLRGTLAKEYMKRPDKQMTRAIIANLELLLGAIQTGNTSAIKVE